MWLNYDPGDVATGLLDVLFAMFRLENAYVRFDEPDGERALERWRPKGPLAPHELAPVLADVERHAHGTVTTPMTIPTDDGALRVTRMASMFPGESGLVLVGCRRSDFPTDLELHLLRIAIGQATISIHTARRLADERAARLSAEAALRQRNTFLASLSQDMNISLAMLAQWAAEAKSLTAEVDRTAALASGEVDLVANAASTSGLTSSVSYHAAPARLTRRETEVLGLLAQGLSNKEIAAVLWLSERTIERHITSLYRKIEVQRRSEATAYALHHGLVATDVHEA
jgi:DNA-binding NarL/FixJ family response regulator